MKFRTISLETEISLMIERYSVGIDFGTLSARAILVDTHSGREVFTSIYGYQDAVIDRSLPQSAEELPADYALQNPADYISAVKALLKDITNKILFPSASILRPARCCRWTRTINRCA